MPTASARRRCLAGTTDESSIGVTSGIRQSRLAPQVIQITRGDTYHDDDVVIERITCLITPAFIPTLSVCVLMLARTTTLSDTRGHTYHDAGLVLMSTTST